MSVYFLNDFPFLFVSNKINIQYTYLITYNLIKKKFESR